MQQRSFPHASASQALAALRAVHGAGYLHGDVCLPNFMVENEGQGQVREAWAALEQALNPVNLLDGWPCRQPQVGFARLQTRTHPVSMLSPAFLDTVFASCSRTHRSMRLTVAPPQAGRAW